MAATENTNLELLTLVWLDVKAGATKENRHVQDKLRGLINHFRIFENCESCEHYIRSAIDDRQEKVILIVSGQLGKDITERVHNLKQVSAIFVYCFNKQKNEEWAKQFPKVAYPSDRVALNLRILLF